MAGKGGETRGSWAPAKAQAPSGLPCGHPTPTRERPGPALPPRAPEVALAVETNLPPGGAPISMDGKGETTPGEVGHRGPAPPPNSPAGVAAEPPPATPTLLRLELEVNRLPHQGLVLPICLRLHLRLPFLGRLCQSFHLAQVLYR